MATIAQLTPKMEPNSNVKVHQHTKPAVNQKEAESNNVCSFVKQEVDMMPGQWSEPGNPTPYELRVTIETCKRLWKLNKEALNHPECNVETTQYNIKILEKLYINLMDYLVE